MRYASAKIADSEEEVFYRAYMAETTRIGTNNSAKLYGGQTIEKRYFDLLEDTEVKVETRTSAQIISHMKQKIKEVE